jgi:hypothetical protein
VHRDEDQLAGTGGDDLTADQLGLGKRWPIVRLSTLHEPPALFRYFFAYGNMHFRHAYTMTFGTGTAQPQ